MNRSTRRKSAAPHGRHGSPPILYVSYDGMLEPLGQSQVLAYLERLAGCRSIHLISFEKKADWEQADLREAVRARIGRAAIRWHPLAYHKTPTGPATAFDIAAGTAKALAVALRHHVGLVHARSYVAGLIALAVKRATGADFLFDMRGLWADERVDGGLWPAGSTLYRAAKRAERSLLLGADHVVMLTSASKEEISKFPYLGGHAPPISVIPTCADLDRFRIQGPLTREPFVLGYVGSVGTWYLLDEMLRCFASLRASVPAARLLIVNRGEHALIRDRAGALGVAPEDMEIVSARHAEMPAQIARMSAAMALIRPTYSKLASAPTKIAEYLGCGVPCLGNRGIGDVEQVLEGKRVGVVASAISETALAEATNRLLELVGEPSLQQRCRKVAEEMFSLDAGVAAYDEIYRSLQR